MLVTRLGTYSGCIAAGRPVTSMSNPIESPPPGLTAYLPKTLWIELTSKCPFDCIFCSRKSERGAGRHMDFPLYRSLIGQLHQPEVIRLNYSGESLHYPYLADAIRLARSTGATTELVSALGSAPQSVVESLVDAGLHRLSVSIHSMDSAQYRAIYQQGGITDMLTRLEGLQRYKQNHTGRYPEIDFAFVAMRENLSQLLPVVAYAGSLGVTSVSVHPVIRRGQAPLQFPLELDEAGCLRADFAALVRAEVARVSASHPAISITVARPDHGSPTTQRGITTCEQNPWDTIHVLANGGVVVCEVQDRLEIGNLHDETLSAIWNGSSYAAFRRQYFNGSHPACVACPWRRSVPPESAKKITVRGWHPPHGETVEWSEASAAIAVGSRHGAIGVRLAGILPPPPHGSPGNSLVIRSGPGSELSIRNASDELLSFQAELPLSPVLQFEIQHRFCPAERGTGADIRNLGFALTDFTFVYGKKRETCVRRLLDVLERTERVAALSAALRSVAPKTLGPPPHGVSILIPARDTPGLLGPTLFAAEAALARVGEPAELIVVVSDAPASAYTELRSRFPRVIWIFHQDALGYLPAVELGLKHAAHPWLYLLNSDMLLHPDALAEVLKLRRADTFAIGSRIKMQDDSDRETNWTDIRFRETDAAELIERDPGDLREPRGCLYVGGGSGLFRASLLNRFIQRTRAYAPFYWEDVEWGAIAWRSGFQCTFCPASHALHGHRETISRYYPAAEVARIFERNRTLFHLRNLTGLRSLEERLLSLDPRTWQELFRPASLAGTVWTRATAFLSPHGAGILRDRWRIKY